MGECLAARLKDPIEHTSFWADVASTVMEIGAYTAAGLAVAAAVAGAVILTVGTGGAGTGFIALTCSYFGAASFGTSLAIGMSGMGEKISSWCNETANDLFPPEICGHIKENCSKNVITKGQPAARASGTIDADALMAQLAAENAPPEPEEGIDWLAIGKTLLAAAESAMNPATVMESLWQHRSAIAAGAEAARKSVMEGLEAAGNKLKNLTADDVLDGLSSVGKWFKHVGDEFLQPTVKEPDPGAHTAETDIVECTKSSSHNIAYIAQGSRKVLINSQPAARTDDLTTCEAKLKPVHPSRQVRIGGSTATVRKIHSGEDPVAAHIELLTLLLPGKGKSKLACLLMNTVSGAVAGQVVTDIVNAISNASHNPVHATTGVKVLGDEREEDFSIPGMIPLNWQRFYTSATERVGVLGRGWRLPWEMSIETDGNEDEAPVTLVTLPGIPVEVGVVPRGGCALLAWMGLRLYRSRQNVFLLETLAGDYFLFEPSAENHWRLTRQSDRHYNSLYYRYGSDGRLDFIHDDSHSIQVHLEYQNYGLHTRLARVWEAVSDDEYRNDERGEEKYLKVEYDYDTAGMLTTVHNATGFAHRRFTYNDQQLMTSHRYGDGAIYHYCWQHFPGTEPSLWRVSEHWTELDGRAVDHHRMDWNLAENRMTVTRDNLGQQHWLWDDNWQVTEYTQADGGIWHYEWDDDGNQTRTVTPDGGEYRMSYDRNGNQRDITDPAGRRESVTWHEHWAFPVSETDADGNRWISDYDKHGDRVKVTDPEGHVTRYRYDDAGLVTEIVDANGNVLKQEWNERGQITETVDCSGYRAWLRYDSRGRPEAHTDARQQMTTFTHDELNRLITVTLNDQRHLEYCWTPGGSLESVTQPDGLVTHYRHDGRGLLTEVAKPDGTTIRAGYDDAGRTLWLENEKGERYAFEHDALHRLISQTDIGGISHHWLYTATGLMTEHRMDGVPLNEGDSPQSLIYRYGHDASGRLIRRDNGEMQLRYEYGKNAVTLKRFRHDELQRAEAEKRVPEPLDKIKLEYDGRGLLTAEENSAGRHKHDYDPLGNLLKTTLPDGRSLENLYYGSGHLLEMQLRDGDHTFQLAEYERDNLHREVHRRQGNLWRQTEYDVAGRISHRRTAKERNSVQGITAQEWYSWDSGDRLIQERVSWPKEPVPAVRVYRWDSAGRIIRVEHNDSSGIREEEFRYDACGNLFDSKPCQASRTEEYRNTYYRYDEFGRLSRKWNASLEQRFEYDADSRLVKVENVRGTVYTQVEMEYDLLGRRTLKRARHRWTNATEETQFGWTGLRLYGEKQPGCPEVLYSYEEGSYAPLARMVGRGETTKIQWFRNGLNGCPEALTDADGELKWRQHQTALWGKMPYEDLTDGQGVMQNLRFQGQYLDRETGLHYNLFRYYDPDCGGFTQPDPIGLAGGLNSYAYAPNPLKYIDPLGLCKVEGARARQAQMLQDDVGYNISPKSWDQYPAIGRDGTFVTDKEGALKYFSGIENGNVTISKSLASTIEKDMGLYPGSLSDGFNIRKVDGISNMQPRSPLSGNDYFLGPGQHLPGGAPEMVINSIPTSTPVTIRVNVN